MKRSLVLFIPVLLLAACVERGKPHYPHAPGVKDGGPENSPAAPPAPSAAADPALQPLKSGTAQSILVLAEEILRNEVVQSAEKSAQPETARKLHRLNEELKAALGKPGEPPAEVTAAAKLYAKFLLADCGPGKTRCPNLEFFAHSSLSAGVAEELAVRYQSDLNLYYQFLAAALELKSSTFDSQLSRLFVAKAKDYLDIIAADEPQRARRFTHLLTTMTRQLVQRGSKEDARELAEILNLVEPAARARLAVLGYGADSLVELLALGGVMRGENAKRDGVVKTHFARPQSLKSAQEALLARNRQMVNQLNMEKSEAWDQITYVIDQAFLGEITTDQAIALLKTAAYERENIFRRFRQVLNIRFLETLATTTQVAQRIFFEKNVPGREFLFHALRSGSEVAPTWGIYTQRAETLRKVAYAAIRVGNAEDELYRKTKTLFNGVPMNVKLIATYPQMMALAFYMAKREASISYNSFGRAQTIDSTIIIEQLFMGFFGPWFEYSEDYVPLNTLQILYAFDFALRTGVFQLFRINPDDLVVELIDRLTRRSIKDLAAFTKLVSQRLAGENFAQMYQFCSNADNGLIATHLDLQYLALYNPLLGHHAETIFETSTSASPTNGQKEGSTEKTIQGIMLFDGMFAARAEESRLDLENIERWMNALLKSYRSFLEQHDPANVEAKLSRSRAAIKLLHKARVDFLTIGAKAYRRLNHCYYKLARIEDDAKVKLVNMEAAHLRQVYDDIGKVRENKMSLSQLKAKYAFKNLPSGFTGLDRFADDSYVYHQVDSLIRLAGYMQNGLKTDRGEFPPVAPHVDVNFGSRLDDESDQVVKSKSVRLRYIPGKPDDFVQTGIQAYMNSPLFVHWGATNDGKYFLGWKESLHNGGILYRVSDPEILREICKSPGACANDHEIVTADEMLASHRNMMSLLAIDPKLRPWLEAANIDRRLDPIYLGRVIWDFKLSDYQISDLWGLFDLPVQIVTEDILGATYSARELQKMAQDVGGLLSMWAAWEAFHHLSYRDLGQRYFDIRAKTSRHLLYFPANSAIDSYLDHDITSLIQRETGRIEHFITAAEKMIGGFDGLPVEERPRVDYLVTESIRGPFLRPSLVPNYRSELEMYHSHTNRCYKKGAPPCEDFAE
jgi:hypothetical protein